MEVNKRAMKIKGLKRLGIIAALAVAMAGGIACASLSGCVKTSTYVGEMHYEQYNTEYGIKVSVQVQADKKGDRIRKVTVLESDYVEASPAMNGWDPKAWNEQLQTLLNAYRGKYVKDIMALEVATADSGAPYVKGDAGFVAYDDDLIMTGATLGSGRLLLAVQDALSKMNG